MTKIKFINKNTVEVTNAFYKQAHIFGTDEYKLWKEVLKDVPDATMKKKTIAKKADKKTYKNLTYANMEKYIRTQSNSEELLEKLRIEKERADIQTSPYRAVLAWFLKEFPDYDSYKEIFAA